MDHSKGVFGDLLSYYGERTYELITLLANNETFIQGFQRVLSTSAEFRLMLTRAVRNGVEQLPLPTLQDFDELREGQEELSQRLYDLDERLFGLEQRLDTLIEQTKPKTKKPRRTPKA